MTSNTQNWDINTAISFVHNHRNREDIRMAEKFFTEKLKSTNSSGQKAEHYYHLLRCKLMQHTVFETDECKKLYNEMLKCFKKVEKNSIKDYRNNKDEITKSEIHIFYLTMEHYMGSLRKLYLEKNFTNAVDRAYTDEMNFRRDEYKIKGHYLKYILYIIFETTSKYGSSMGRWLLTTLMTTVIFAFMFFTIDSFLLSADRMIDVSSDGRFFDYMYYSIITFTTLGYGDISPVSVLGEFLAMVEVSVGYLMLGVLVSLLGKKL